uniref:Uncharacterized protein n=1 Tax=Brassica oleracea TaxID=3712 RepID=A0A3P6CQU8_BRAOL|nr:unnamed protein product [Brassica oleracea]
MVINVSKDDDGVSLEFRVSAYANVIVIDSVSIKQPQESQNPDQGPDFDYVFLEIRGPVQTAPQDSKPVKKLKLILGSETKKTSPFIERRDGDKEHFSLEKDGEIETRPGEPTSKIIPKEKYDITQQEKFSVYPPEIYDKLNQPSIPNKSPIKLSRQLTPRCWSGKRRAGSRSALYLGAGGEDA